MPDSATPTAQAITGSVLVMGADVAQLFGMPTEVWVGAAAGSIIFLFSKQDLKFYERIFLTLSGLFGAVFVAKATHAWLGINLQYLPALGYVYSTCIVVLAQRLALQAKTADVWALIVNLLPGRRPPPP